MRPSSQDLHPQTGARFVFDRQDDGAEDPRYAVAVYLPEQRGWSGQLSWLEGSATLVADEHEPEPQAWVRDEALKLARVLRRTPKQHMVRWRPTPTD